MNDCIKFSPRNFALPVSRLVLLTAKAKKVGEFIHVNHAYFVLNKPFAVKNFAVVEFGLKSKQ